MIKDKFRIKTICTRMKNNKKIFTIGLIALIATIVIIAWASIIANNIKKENNLNEIYIAIKDNNDWTYAKFLIDEYSEDKDFVSSAHDKVFEALSDKLKSNDTPKELMELLNCIKQNFDLSSLEHSKINNYKTLTKKYIELENIDSIIQEEGYISAYEKLCNMNSTKDENLKNKIKEKQQEILDNTLQEVILKAEEQINMNNYQSAKDILKGYIKLKNETITNLYNTVTTELNKQNQEISEVIETANTYMAKKDYLNTMKVLENYLNTDNSKKNEINKIYNNAKQEHENVNKSIEEAKFEINYGSYSSAMYTLEKYLNIGYSEVDNLYKQAKNAKEKEDAKRIAEEKARKKSEGVRIGMSKQDVLDSSWGEPKKINTSIGSWGTHEQWVYGNGNYLYFENGKLTSIQN